MTATRKPDSSSPDGTRHDGELFGVPTEVREQDLFQETKFFFQPVQESLRDLEAHLDPRGKQVVSVMAYGGYPSFFVTGEVERVVSFDVDPRQVGWNLVLREGLRNLDYESGRGYLLHEAEGQELQDLHDEIFATMPTEHVMSALAMSMMYERAWDGEAVRRMGERGELYPHLRDRASWDAARARVLDGAWDIRHTELLELLEQLESEGNQEQIDILYISTIRNWFLRYRLDGDPDSKGKFAQYDGRLSECAQRLLRSGGKIYEAIINDGGSFPRFPMDADTYPGFRISRSPSRTRLPTEIVLAERI